MEFSALRGGWSSWWLGVIFAGMILGMAASSCRDIDEPPPEIERDGGAGASEGGLAGMNIFTSTPLRAA
jgi:hypothetical protein